MAIGSRRLPPPIFLITAGSCATLNHGLVLLSPSPSHAASLAWQPVRDASRWTCAFASRLHQTAVAAVPRRAFHTLICHFDNRIWLFQSEHETD